MCRRRTFSSKFEMVPILYQYTGNYQTFTAPATGWYKIECWGAQGCYSNSNYGGYTAGKIRLIKREILYIYVGNGGKSLKTNDFNGGGRAYFSASSYLCGAGGSATDVRLISGLWNNVSSLRSRIIVAAGGPGGYGNRNFTNVAAGGLVGDNGINFANSSSFIATGGTQTSGGIGSKTSVHPSIGYAPQGTDGGFGFAGTTYPSVADGLGSGGGSGYYGGGGGGTTMSIITSGAGGSSFISGHTGCDAVNSSGTHTGQPNHYSEKIFQDSQMIDGAGYQWTAVKGSLLLMPNPLGGSYASGVGHSGSGFCKISKAI